VQLVLKVHRATKVPKVHQVLQVQQEPWARKAPKVKPALKASKV
jgi:hypothetical protein